MSFLKPFTFVLVFAALTASAFAQGGQVGQRGIYDRLNPSSPPTRTSAPRIAVPRQPDPIHLSVRTQKRSYDVGDEMMIQVRADRDSYLYLFATDRGGNTRLIFPSAFQRDNFVRGGVSRLIPLHTYRLLADGPAGRETLTAVASTDRYDWLHEVLPREGRTREDRGFPLATVSPQELHERLAASAEREYHARIAAYRARVERRLERSRAAGVHPRTDDLLLPALPAAGIGETRVRLRDPRGLSRTMEYRYRDREQRTAEHRIPPIRAYHDGHTGFIRIESTPSRGHVTINGHYVGTTPLRFEAPIGRHDVVVERAGYETWEHRVRVFGDRERRYRFTMAQW